MAKKDNNTIPLSKQLFGITYTRRDEIRYRVACILAKGFMRENYGNPERICFGEKPTEETEEI